MTSESNRRPSRDSYYMQIARAVAERATCSRAQHGAVIVVEDAIAATGFNGAPRGTRHCDHVIRPGGEPGDPDAEGDMEGGHCSRAVHAESNAVINAARQGSQVLGGTMYVTGTPCYRCAPQIVNAGITRVVYASEYRPDGRALALFDEANILLEKLAA